MPINKPVNKAIDEAVNAAVFVDLVGELGPLIEEAAASAGILVDEAINKAAASARMLADVAIDKGVDTAVFVVLGGELGPLIIEAAASAQMPVDKAIDNAVDAAVFIDFVGINKAIDEAAASTPMMADKAINEAAASARMMANKAINKVVAARPRGSCQGCCTASATGGTQQSNRDGESERGQRTGGVVAGGREVDTPANERQCRNERHGEEEEVADTMAMMEEDAVGVGMMARG
jgi:hypothetical protein